MRLSIKLYRVSCSHPKNVKEGIPYEVLSDAPDFLLDESLKFKLGEMEMLKEAEIKALMHEGLFYKNLLSKRKKWLDKWLDRRQYIQDMDSALLWVRDRSGKGKVVLLNEGERTDLFSITASLRYCGKGEFKYSGIQSG